MTGDPLRVAAAAFTEPGGPTPYLVDERGHACPLPVIALARAAADRTAAAAKTEGSPAEADPAGTEPAGTVLAGAVLVVVADDPAARHDIPAWCQLRGHTYLGDVPLGEAEPSEASGATAYGVRLEPGATAPRSD